MASCRGKKPLLAIFFRSYRGSPLALSGLHLDASDFSPVFLDEFVADFRAFGEEVIDCGFCRVGACAVGAPVAAVAFVELFDQVHAAESVGAFRFYQSVHLVAPDHAVFGAAELAQIVDGAKDFRQAVEFFIIGFCACIAGGG